MHIATSEIIRKDEFSNNLEWTLQLLDSAIDLVWIQTLKKTLLNVNGTYLLRFHESMC